MISGVRTPPVGLPLNHGNSVSVQFSPLQFNRPVVSNSLRPHEHHAACQASLSITNSRSLPKLMSIELVMPSNHLILCHPLLLLSSIFPSIREFSNESALCIRWPKYWSFSFSINPFNENSGLVSVRIDWFDLLQFSRSVLSNSLEPQELQHARPP